MEVTGKIILALPPQSGVSKNGNNWHKREYVLETNESFPKKIHFDFFGDRADQFPLNVGDMIRLSFDIESREYNGRWCTGRCTRSGTRRSESGIPSRRFCRSRSGTGSCPSGTHAGRFPHASRSRSS